MIIKRLKEARIKANITKAEMARKLGVAYSTYDGYETGYREPKLETLQKIASALGVPLSQLLTQNEQIGTAYLEYFSSDTNEGRSRQLHRSFDLLNEEDQTKVIDYSDSLLKAEMYEAQKNAPEQK